MALVAVEAFQAHVEGAAAVAGERDVKFKRLLTVLASEEPEQGDAERLELEELVWLEWANVGFCRLLSAAVRWRLRFGHVSYIGNRGQCRRDVGEMSAAAGRKRCLLNVFRCAAVLSQNLSEGQAWRSTRRLVMRRGRCGAGSVRTLRSQAQRAGIPCLDTSGETSIPPWWRLLTAESVASLR